MIRTKIAFGLRKYLSEIDDGFDSYCEKVQMALPDDFWEKHEQWIISNNNDHASFNYIVDKAQKRDLSIEEIVDFIVNFKEDKQ